MKNVEQDKVTRIFPQPHQTLALRGLYLNHEIAVNQQRQTPFVYANYVVSMDGRIALTQPNTGEKGIPESIANDSDWRLYQELAAQADVLVSSSRYIREMADSQEKQGLPVGKGEEFADLLDWRASRGLPAQPALAVVTSSLDLPWEKICQKLDRPIFAVTTGRVGHEQHDKLASLGVRIIRTGESGKVEGERLINGLAEHGFYNIYVIAGPKVLGTLIESNALDRLYLTQVHKLVGGRHYDTFLDTAYLENPLELKLRCQYLNVSTDRAIEQSFAVYDVCRSANQAAGGESND